MLVGDHEMRVPKIICPEKLCVFLLIKIIPLKIEFIFLCNDVVKTPKNFKKMTKKAVYIYALQNVGEISIKTHCPQSVEKNWL